MSGIHNAYANYVKNVIQNEASTVYMTVFWVNISYIQGPYEILFKMLRTPYIFENFASFSYSPFLIG